MSVVPGSPLSAQAARLRQTATRSLGIREIREDRALRLTSVVVFVALFLQRFSIPVGTGVDVVGPIDLIVVGVGLLQGVFALDRVRLGLYVLLAFGTLVGLVWHVTGMSGVQFPVNMASLSQFLVVTSFAVFSFAHPVDEKRFFETFNFPLLLIAICGIAQFFAQFVGLKLFSFTNLLPDAMLFEGGYNLEIPVGVGTVLKSNGFFLLEPSVLSQMMAVGLIAEVLASRRPLYLAVFSFTLLLSFSGTGWLVLGGFLIGVVFSLGARGALLAGLVIVVLGVFGAIALVVAPDFAFALIGRVGEFTMPGTSGHLRFITPFWFLTDVISQNPMVSVFGLGAGISERLGMPYDYTINTPIKVAIDYGVPVLIVYLSLLFYANRTATQRALVLPAAILVLFTGGYQEFPPILFLVLLLITVGWLRPSDTEARPAVK